MNNRFFLCSLFLCFLVNNTLVFCQSDKFRFEKKLSFKGEDTLECYYYKNGKMASSRLANPRDSKYIYSRFYQNGKLMLTQTMLGNKMDGPSIFFNEKGKKILTVNYKNNNPIDTLIHHKKSVVLFGNYHSFSRVYGGAENADGTSNVQQSEGPVFFFDLKLIQYPSDAVGGKKLYELQTDSYGQFCLILPKGNYKLGLFPKNYPNDKIKENMMFPPDSVEQSGNSSWSILNELILTKHTSFIYTELRSSSVGYAP